MNALLIEPESLLALTPCLSSSEYGCLSYVDGESGEYSLPFILAFLFIADSQHTAFGDIEFELHTN